MSEQHPINIIGFDLGHGETALAQVQLDSKAEPESLLLNTKKSQITAIAHDPKKGTTIIGEMAYRLPGATAFQICFKKRPSNEPRYQQTIRDFAKTVYEHLIDSRQIEAGEHNHFFVGCPSGWKDKEREDYRQLLTAYTLPNVKVVPESRAALMHAQESGKLKMGEQGKSVLVIDVGSSTTDFTLVIGRGDNPMLRDDGIDLGAALIDKAILAQSLADHPDKARLQEIFEQDSRHKDRCELVCRKAKEEYFEYPTLYEEPESFVGVLSERISQRLSFAPSLDGPTMKDILRQPMPELGYRSWSDAFRHKLRTVKQELDQQRVKPAVIILTGGASKMDFIPEICTSVFSKSRLEVDTEPELCIAKGLARWGWVDIHTTEFTKEMTQFFDRELEGIIERHTPGLIDLLAEKLADGLVEQVVKPRLLAWRNGQIKTLNDLEASIESKSESWLKGYRAKGLIKGVINEWLGTVQEEVTKQSDPICLKHGISAGGLQIGRVGFQTELERIGIVQIEDMTMITEVINTIINSAAVGIMIASVTSVVGVIIGAFIAVLLVMVSQEVIKDRNFAQFIRNMVSDDKINSVAKEKKPELKQKIKNMLTDDKALMKKLLQPIHQGLRKALEERADKARLLIV